MADKKNREIVPTTQDSMRKAAAQNIHLLGGTLEDIVKVTAISRSLAENYMTAIDTVENSILERMLSCGRISEETDSRWITDALVRANAHRIAVVQAPDSLKCLDDMVLAMPFTSLSSRNAAKVLGVDELLMQEVYSCTKKHTENRCDRLQEACTAIDSERDLYEYSDRLHPAEETSMYLWHKIGELLDDEPLTENQPPLAETPEDSLILYLNQTTSA